MRPQSRVAATIAAVTAAVLLPACQASKTYEVKQLGVQFSVADDVSDLVHVMGDGGEGERAAFFSTKSLIRLGGPKCAAGVQASVSPFPLGMIIVADETPEKVAEERRENPEEGLGEFVKRVGDRYLYYRAPPEESCAPDKPKAVSLQRRAVVLLRKQLAKAEPS